MRDPNEISDALKYLTESIEANRCGKFRCLNCGKLVTRQFVDVADSQQWPSCCGRKMSFRFEGK